MDLFIWDVDDETPEAPEGLAERLAQGFGEADLDGRTADGDLWEADDRAA